MKIIINQVPAEGLYLEEKIEPAQLDLETALIRFRSPLKLAARITRVTNALMVDLNINAVIFADCSRVLPFLSSLLIISILSTKKSVSPEAFSLSIQNSFLGMKSKR